MNKKNKNIIEFEYDWKAIRDMAKKGIGHSGLSKVANHMKKEEKNKKK